MRSLILGGIASLALAGLAHAAPPFIPVVPIVPFSATTPEVTTEPCPQYLSLIEEVLDDRCWHYPQILAAAQDETAGPVPVVTPITVYAAAPEALWAFNYRDETWPGDGSYKVWASASREYCEADRAGMPVDKVSTSACVYTREYSSAH